MDNDILHPQKKHLRKGRRSSHIIVKDRDLQIHIPTIEETHHTHRSADFKTRTVPFSERLLPSTLHEDEVKVAMAEAENAYDSMMQIRKQLMKAYEEFIRHYCF